ncbi:MAG: DUF4159 domain-containing protein [Myxococcota bacterium]
MDRRDFLKAAGLAGLASILPSRAFGMGEDERFTIAKLQYASSGWDPRSSALRRMLLEVEKRTSIKVRTDIPVVTPDSKDMYSQPFLSMSGESAYGALAPEAVENLRTYLKAGGFLLIDSAEGVRDGPFTRSARRTIERVLPDQKLAPIPKDHVLYKSFYLIDTPVGRVSATDEMMGVFEDDRLLVVLSPNDLMGAWARDNFGNWEYSVAPGGQRQRELAFRMGINLAMYALSINYKADQVHVPFILRRRQWKVD